VHTNQIRGWKGGLVEYSDQMETVEKCRRNGDRIEGEITLYDPEVLVQPVTTRLNFRLDKETRLELNRPLYNTCTDTNGPSMKVFMDKNGFLNERLVGDPLDPTTQMGPQCSKGQLEKILSYIEVGKQEGAKCMTGGEQANLGGALANGNYVKPTVFVGHNKMRIFQEEIFGPVLSVTKFKTLEEAIEIGNDTIYGLGAGVWSRDGGTAYRVGREIQAGRVWTNCYHVYPAHAAFGGYKQSGFGRETHKMVLDHYQQTKNLLVSYRPNAFGFF